MTGCIPMSSSFASRWLTVRLEVQMGSCKLHCVMLVGSAVQSIAHGLLLVFGAAESFATDLKKTFDASFANVKVCCRPAA